LYLSEKKAVVKFTFFSISIGCLSVRHFYWAVQDLFVDITKRDVYCDTITGK